MQILDNIIILLLLVLAFVAGKKISDGYHKAQNEALTNEIKRLSLMHGIGYVPPEQPVRKYVPIGQPFMDKLKDNGRAVQKLDHKP